MTAESTWARDALLDILVASASSGAPIIGLATDAAGLHKALVAIEGDGGVATAPAVEEGTHEPAVSIRKSLASRDHILSLIDGKPYKTLRRHLARHGLTPEQYRERYGLKPDYPIVSESYSEARRDMAKRIGLGRKR